MVNGQTFTQLLCVSSPSRGAGHDQDRHCDPDPDSAIPPAAASSAVEPTPEYDATILALQDDYPDLVATLAELDARTRDTAGASR
jgi:hypothetical protein